MKKAFYLFILLLVLSAGIFLTTKSTSALSTPSRLKGKILLQVESRGEAWYISPGDSKRYSLGKQDDAFNLMRSMGIGISNSNLAKIKIANENLTGQDSDNDGLSDMAEDSIGTDKNNQDSDHDGFKDKDEVVNGYNPNSTGKQSLDNNFAKNQAGKILLQVEKHGEAWYVNPDNQLRYFLGRPGDAYNLMRKLGLGISNNDLNKITPAISQNDFQPYQLDVVNEIIKSRENLGEEEWPIMSWNDKKYGRLYAVICSSPTPMYACSDCMDGGVNYFDAKGDYIGNCNSMGSDEIKPPYNCNDLTNLNYRDADYVSKSCSANVK